MGMRTANFRRIEHVEKFRGRAAFSIITHDRTLDILCPTPEIMDQWVFGLRFLVGRLQPSPTVTQVGRGGGRTCGMIPTVHIV
jgi:hypothetical protein